MSTELVSLIDLIDRHGAKTAQNIVDRFTCPFGDDEVDFLKTRSVTMEKKELCRTYLLVDGADILGFFTVGIKCTVIPKDSKLSRKFTSRLGINPGNDVAQCFLLAQLCRSGNSDKGTGRRLIMEAIKILSKANRLVGCRSIRLDCSDELVDYYSELGFVNIKKNAEEDLNQMIMLIPHGLSE